MSQSAYAKEIVGVGKIHHLKDLSLQKNYKELFHNISMAH